MKNKTKNQFSNLKVEIKKNKVELCRFFLLTENKIDSKIAQKER